ncbi:DUF4397 domain-containing protein [bacterium]|nr:DUF4397 domain-containing protein [bacterium]
MHSRIQHHAGRLALLLLLIGIFTAALIPGCSGDDDDDDDDDASDDDTADDDTEELGTAHFRAVHVAPNVTEVDIYLDEDISPVQDLFYTGASGYVAVDATTHSVDVVPSGDSISDTIFTINNVDFADDTDYTLATIGNIGSKYRVMTLQEDRSAVADNSTRVQAVHAADGVGSVDVWNVPDGGAASLLFSDLSFAAASGFSVLPSGSYTLGVDTNDDGSLEATYDVTLKSADIVSLYVIFDGGIPRIVSVSDNGDTKVLLPK